MQQGMQGIRLMYQNNSVVDGAISAAGSNHLLTVTAEATVWGGATVILQMRTQYTESVEDTVLGIDDTTIFGTAPQVMLGIAHETVEGGWINLPYSFNGNGVVTGVQITPGCQIRALLLNASSTTEQVTVCIG
jgi:hypothetical protein